MGTRLVRVVSSPTTSPASITTSSSRWGGRREGGDEPRGRGSGGDQGREPEAGVNCRQPTSTGRKRPARDGRYLRLTPASGRSTVRHAECTNGPARARHAGGPR